MQDMYIASIPKLLPMLNDVLKVGFVRSHCGGKNKLLRNATGDELSHFQGLRKFKRLKLLELTALEGQLVKLS